MYILFLASKISTFLITQFQLELLEDIMWLIAIVTETCRLSECGCTVSGIKCLMAEKTAVFILEISNRLIGKTFFIPTRDLTSGAVMGDNSLKQGCFPI